MPLHPDFIRTYDQTDAPSESAVLLAFTDQGLLCSQADGRVSLPLNVPENNFLLKDARLLTLGNLNGKTYIGLEVSGEAASQVEEDALKSFDIRTLFGQLELQDYLIAGYAAQILHWRRTSGYCPVCGGVMGDLGAEWSRKCTVCGHERYPQVCPALLILVHDGGDGILMAHKPGWGERYSIFAGFVLPGESLEECVHREVDEEAGVLVGDLEYSGSQPWPFPHQLMIGFRAKYLSGDIRIDQLELDDARWFRTDTMPALPGPLSLSRQMIEAWLAERR